jgi:hypothetical protein
LPLLAKSKLKIVVLWFGDLPEVVAEKKDCKKYILAVGWPELKTSKWCFGTLLFQRLVRYLRRIWYIEL